MQQEKDKSGKRFLTCYLLPQAQLSKEQDKIKYNQHAINESLVRERYLDDIRVHQLHDMNHHLAPMISQNGINQIIEFKNKPLPVVIDRTTLVAHHNLRENFNVNHNGQPRNTFLSLNGNIGKNNENFYDSRQHLIRFNNDVILKY